MNIAGKIVGCHTCGTRSAEYIADHQPPLKFVKRENAKFWRKYFLGPISQDFYPQCKACSLVQSQVVRMEPSKRPLNYHWTTIRAHQFTGLAIGLVFIVFQLGSSAMD